MPASAAHSKDRTDRIQDGIYFRSGETPPPCWRLLLLNAPSGASPRAVRAAVGRVVETLRAMQQGDLGGDLAGVAPKPTPGAPKADPLFMFLLGYGARFFDKAGHHPALTGDQRPDFLNYLHRKTSAFPNLPWAEDSNENPGEADFCIQLTGVTESAVNRAIVEVWNELSDNDSPLTIAGMYSGFQRDDGRSWLGFHDGVSNIQSSQRRAALEALADPPWIEGGTYMAFLRFEVDLAGWRGLTRAEQEIVVGRDKLTGCPLVGVRKKGGKLVPEPRPGCPEDDDQSSYRDPPQQTDRLLEASHVHRANQSRAAPTTLASRRIFRQGYEFLESFSPDGPRLGLNFVSFQNDLEHLVRVLDLPGWLGDVNFGGPAQPRPGEPPQLELLKLLVGGLYAVPPRAEPFAGADLFRPA